MEPVHAHGRAPLSRLTAATPSMVNKSVMFRNRAPELLDDPIILLIPPEERADFASRAEPWFGEGLWVGYECERAES